MEYLSASYSNCISLINSVYLYSQKVHMLIKKGFTAEAFHYSYYQLITMEFALKMVPF